MLAIEDFLDHLRLGGVQLWLQDGKVRYRPSGALGQEDLAILRARTAEVVAALGGGTPVRTARPATIPLSAHQEGMWFLDQLGLLGTAYNQTQGYRITGDLDTSALRAAVAEIVRRHEILRTRFPAVDGVGAQVVEPCAAVPFRWTDLSELQRDAQTDRLSAIWRDYADHRFDLSEDLSFQTELVRLSPTDHVLIFRAHHLVIDGPSHGILFAELRAIYAALRAGQPSPLPELALQYADYAVWQQERAHQKKAAEDLEYWRRELSGAPDRLELPLDHPRSELADRAADVVSVPVDPQLLARLRELAQRHNTTLFTVLLGGFHALLARWSGQADISVGLAVDARSHPQVEANIGHFINTIVLRMDVPEDLTFADLLTREKERVVEAYEHRHLPIDRLVAELHPQRELSIQPLYQVMFTYMVSESLDLDGLQVEPLDIDSQSAMFDLMLFAAEKGDRLEIGLEYARNLFERHTIQRLAGYFCTLLAGAAAMPEARVEDLPLMSQAQQQELLAACDGPVSAVESGRCVHDLITEQAHRTPEATALVFQDRSLSYRELNGRANALAAQLRNLGVGPDKRVGICLPRSLELVVAILAVWKAGGAYVPIDLSYPVARQRLLAEDAGLHLLIASSEEAADIASPDVPVLDPGEFAGDAGAPDVSGPVHPENLAWVLYTSGSTGRPKGVAMPHAPMVSNLRWHLDPAQGHIGRTLMWSALSFDVSFEEIGTTLAAGSTLVLVPEDVRHDFERLLDLVWAERIERLFMPFVALQEFADLAVRLDRVPPDLTMVITAGEQLRATSAVRAFFAALPGCTLYNEYGPIEVHIATSYELPGRPEQWAALPPIGRPLANMSAYVLDGALRPVLPGCAGELYVGGIAPARGYLGNPALTAERFLPDPFRDGLRMYRTGDLARYRLDGQLEFLGRGDDQVKIRGFRVEIGGVEAVLARHPTVRDCAVAAPEYAHGARRLVAYVVAPPGGACASAAQLRAFLAEHLPDYMVPAIFVTLPSLPRTPSGKLNRRSLPPPNDAEWATDAEFVAARDDLEAQIVEVWQDVLAIPRIGVHDNFFELGGRSLLATKVAARLRTLGVSVRLLFGHPTVASLAHHLRDAAADADAAAADADGTADADADADEIRQRSARA